MELLTTIECMHDMRFDDGCGRYTLAVNERVFADHFRLTAAPKNLPLSYDVKPGQVMPIVVASAAGETKIESMRWGLVPFWAKDPKIGYSTFNARDDSVFTKPMWRSIYRQRALIPATGYFEWTKPAKSSGIPKQKFFFRPKGVDIFSFAGFYDSWEDDLGQIVMTYAIITTEPNKEAANIHDRMPVILSPSDERAWLDPVKSKRPDIEPFLHPLADGDLEIAEVATSIKGLSYDDERIIDHLNSK